MTVKDLINELMELPLHYEVFTEGCDCWGEATQAVISDDGCGNDIILIERK